MNNKIGLLPLARETFDIPFARQLHAECLNQLKTLPLTLFGGEELLFDAASAQKAVAEIVENGAELLLVLQITFTDAATVCAIAESCTLPLALWSFPEERSGGRLRLNSFCGINLAAHALSRRGRAYNYLHGKPESEAVHAELLALARAAKAMAGLQNARMLVVGESPEGFDACNYQAEEVQKTFGIEFDYIPVSQFIAEAQKVPDHIATAHLEERKKILGQLDTLEVEPLLHTMRVYHTLHVMVQDKNAIGAAVRCWPQFFTEWGTAACGALAMLGEQQIPGGCEADVYGVLTSKLLNLVADDVAFNTDLVDLDFDSDTCVFWHCGQAPVQMADPDCQPVGTIHTNRKLPLLSQFPLKAGPVTIARLSRGGGQLKLVLGKAEMLKAPLAYAGTSGVARFSTPIKEVADKLMAHGLEHHTAIVYGDYLNELQIFAKWMQLPIVKLG